MLSEASERNRTTGGIPHDEFWRQLDAEYEDSTNATPNTTSMSKLIFPGKISASVGIDFFLLAPSYPDRRTLQIVGLRQSVVGSLRTKYMICSYKGNPASAHVVGNLP
jgi:hypothetical protein